VCSPKKISSRSDFSPKIGGFLARIATLFEIIEGIVST